MRSGLLNSTAAKFLLVGAAFLFAPLRGESETSQIFQAGALATQAIATAASGIAGAAAAVAEAQEGTKTSIITSAIAAKTAREQSADNLEIGKINVLAAERIASQKFQTELQEAYMTNQAKMEETRLHYQDRKEERESKSKYDFELLALQKQKQDEEFKVKQMELKASLVKDGLSTGFSPVKNSLAITSVMTPNSVNRAGSVTGSNGLGKSFASHFPSHLAVQPIQASPVRGISGSEVRSLGESFASIFSQGSASGSTPSHHKRSDLENFQRSMEAQKARSFANTYAVPHQSREARGLASNPTDLPPSTHAR